jgi:sodium/potassium-transporting ATPase subunit alpha
MCTHVLVGNVPVPKDEKWEKIFEEANEYFGNGGQRVLGFAKLHLPRSKYTKDYEFTIDDV